MDGKSCGSPRARGSHQDLAGFPSRDEGSFSRHVTGIDFTARHVRSGGNSGGVHSRWTKPPMPPTSVTFFFIKFHLARRPSGLCQQVTALAQATCDQTEGTR